MIAYLRSWFSSDSAENGVPYFGDVGSSANDLFKDDLDHQKVKIKLSSKSGDNIEFKTTGEHNKETSQTSGKVELKYKHLSNGVTYTESWDLENNISGRVEIEKTVKKRPLNVEIGAGLFPLHETKVAADGTIKYSHPNAAFACSGKYRGEGLQSNHSVVFGNNSMFIGGCFCMDISKKQLLGKEVLFGMNGKSHQLTVGLSDNLDLMKSTIFHDVNPNFSYGIRGNYCFSEKAPALAAAFKYKLNDLSTVRGTLNNGGLLGLSYRHAIRPAVSLVFSTEIDALNFSAGNHRTGLSLELTP